LSPCHRRAKPHAVMMPVGRLVNRSEWLWWSWMCGGCGVGVLFSSVARFVAPCACSPLSCRPLFVSTPIMIHPHHQHVAHTQPFVDVISIKVLAGGPPVTGRRPSSRFVTSHPALYCPDLVCVCVCVCVREQMSLCAQLQPSQETRDHKRQVCSLTRTHA